MQETHSITDVEKQWKKDWGYDIIYNHGTSKSKGVAILLDNKHDYDILDLVSDEQGRFLLLDMEIDGQATILVNVVFPAKDNVKDKQELITFISSIPENYVDKNLIFGGDFNICPDPMMDKKG